MAKWMKALLPALLGLGLLAVLAVTEPPEKPSYQAFIKKAIPASESRFFDIQFALSAPEKETGDGQLKTEPSLAPLRVSIGVSNKSSSVLPDVAFTLYYPSRVQSLFRYEYAPPEPETLFPESSSQAPWGIGHTWSTWIDRTALRTMGSLTVDEFYDAVLHITWRGGQEWIHLDPSLAFSISKEPGTLVEHPLSEEDLARLREKPPASGS